MAVQDASYIGSGRIYLRDRSVQGASLLEVGNVSALTFSPQEEVKTQTDYTTPGGGARNEVRRLSSVEISMTITDLNGPNIARALNGTVSAVAGAVAKTNQAMGTAYKNGFYKFPDIQAASPVPVVRATNGRTAVVRANSTAYALNRYITPATPNGDFYKVTTAGTTAASPPAFGTTTGGTTTDGGATLTNMGNILLVAGTDYELLNTGVRILSAADFTDGELLEADYTTAGTAQNGYSLVQALVKSGVEYELVADLQNEAQSGKRVVINAFRVKLGATNAFGLIGDDYATIEVSGKLLADTSKTSGLSQYFTVAQEGV